MSLIDDEVRAQLQREFAALVNPVRLAVCFQTLADPESEEVRRLVEELCGLDERLTYEGVNFVLDKERAASLGLTRTPAIAVLGETKDAGIRLYGLPSGYEFGTLIDAVLDVSRGESQLGAATLAELQQLPGPVHLQVFSTPT
jgi:alkyl hydroperoxide reductase subunit AhpF